MTTDETTLRADPDVVAAWVAGWALCRKLPAPVPAYGGLRVDVGLPDQKARYVFAAASPQVRRAADAIADENVFLKVCAPPEVVRDHLPPDWLIEPVSFMMTADDLTSPPHGVGGGYRMGREQEGAGDLVRILAADGEVAASGRASVVGSDAIFDQIVTHPEHRRRGLGRAVMGMLAGLARERGASRGLLVATPDGRALYGAMGWRLHCLYTTAVRAAV
jgi:GNAT superfamily N-acetyltransferase